MAFYAQLVDNSLISTPMLEDSTSWNKIKVICHLLQQGGISQTNYALHSFRIGATTPAAATRFPD